MVITDALAVEVAIILTRLARFGLHRPAGRAFLILLVAAPLVWVILFAAFQLYTISRLSPAEEFRRLVEASVIAVAIMVPLLLRLRAPQSAPVSSAWVVVGWLLALTLVLLARKIWHRHMWRLRERGELLYRTLIVGTNDEAVKVAETLRHPAWGFAPIGLVATHFQGEPSDGLPILGSVYQLSELIEIHRVECVFVATSAVGHELMKRIAKELRRHDVEVRVSANLTQILSSRLSVQRVGDLLALSLRPVQLSGSQAAAKRTFDLAVGSLAVILLSPLWLVLAMLIKVTSRGPVLYKQLRVGRNERAFTMYKFRTMVRGADRLLGQLQTQNEASGPLFKMKNDPRVTKLGKWLRKWSLDELPQVINVLKGQMSMVGPRPALPSEVATYEDWHKDRLEVPPGITGLWQVGGRSNLSFDDYVRLDLFYIENWSITYDIFILFKTIPAVLFRKGAF